MQRRPRVWLLIASTGLLACGDGNANTITVGPAQAHEVFVDIANAIGEGLDLQGSNHATTETFTCNGGGNAVVSNLPPVSSPTDSVAIAVSFSQCGGATLTLSGGISYIGKGTNDIGTGTFGGLLHVSGAATGDCVVSLTLASGGAGTSASGTICGLDAGLVFQ